MLNNYNDLVALNPDFPFLVRNGIDIEPKFKVFDFLSLSTSLKPHLPITPCERR